MKSWLGSHWGCRGEGSISWTERTFSSEKDHPNDGRLAGEWQITRGRLFRQRQALPTMVSRGGINTALSPNDVCRVWVTELPSARPLRPRLGLRGSSKQPPIVGTLNPRGIIAEKMHNYKSGLLNLPRTARGICRGFQNLDKKRELPRRPGPTGRAGAHRRPQLTDAVPPNPSTVHRHTPDHTYRRRLFPSTYLHLPIYPPA